MSLPSRILNTAPHWIGRTTLRLLGELEAREQRSVRMQLETPGISELDLQGLRTSNTLFVLGSGSSIEYLTNRQFDFIARHNSIGFNFWLVHTFVPTVYLFYPGGFSTKETFDCYHKLMADRVADYKAVPKIVTDLYRRNLEFIEQCPPEFRSNLYAAERHMVFARDELELGKELKRINKNGAFGLSKKERFANRVFKYGTSLSTTVALGVQMGYTDIVLCGIDLKDSHYFYEDYDKYPIMRGYEDELIGSNRSIPHPTNTRVSPLMLTVAETLRALRDNILTPRGIRLSLQHSGSALYPEFPVFVADGWGSTA